MWCVKTTFYVSKEAFFWRRAIFGKTDSFSIHIRILNQNVFDFCGKKLGRVAKFAFELPKGSFWQKQGFKRKKNLSFFSDFKRTTFGLLAKSFWRRSLNCILHIQSKYSGIFLNLNDPYCLFRTFWKKIWDVFSKLHSMGSRENFFPKKLNFFHVVRTWS